MKNQILKNGIMKIIQISDTHLFAHDESEIFGIKSNIKFGEIVEKILAEDISDTNLIFLTGDISQDETKQSYQKALCELIKLNTPIYWIPGNHDNLHQLESVFKNAKNFIRTQHLSFLNWSIIFLNTKINGAHEGYLSTSELQLLKNEILGSSQAKKIVIVMHHHPAQVGTPLIDHYILRNRDEFWEIVTGTEVELIICGHVHGNYTLKHNNIMIESAPATCLQWQQGTEDLKFDLRIGYKIYYFSQHHYNTICKMW
jgi:3',5'-cyclic-AMP phosphodiesterase